MGLNLPVDSRDVALEQRAVRVVVDAQFVMGPGDPFAVRWFRHFVCNTELAVTKPR